MGDALAEHFGYIDDATRLDRFRAAIAGEIHPGATVADIGCGFGVLGMLCLQAGAARVWGIDETEALAIASEAMARAGLAERYTTIAGSSFQTSLPEPVDLVLCDHVGYFGIDYGVIATLGDARRRLLKPSGRIMPRRILLQVAAVESEACRKLAARWTGAAIPAEFEWLRDYDANTRHPYDFTSGELASAAAELGAIDLREDSPPHLRFSARLEALRDGALDGLAGWFACELADGVWMSNSPLAAGAIRRHQAFLPFATPLAVQAGDVVDVSISMRHEETLIAWSARVERSGEVRKQSTWASKILDPRDRIPPAERVPRLNAYGRARKTLLERVDGTASAVDIESAVVRGHEGLFPATEDIARFVRRELGRSTE